MRARRLLYALCLGALSLIALSALLRAQSATASPPSPPTAAVRAITETYYGTKVTDPYRYMEALEDPEVQSWFKAQNDYARAVLTSLPARQDLLARITELDQSTSADVAVARRLPGDIYLYSKTLAGDETSKLYLRRGLTGADKLLVDPERIAVAETSRAKGMRVINSFVPSDDLRYVAVTIVPGGSEYETEIHIVETSSGREIGDVIRGCCAKSDPTWLPDNRSLIYGRWQTLAPNAPAPEKRQKSRVYVHVLGTKPEKDKPIFGYGVVPSIEVDPHRFATLRTQPDSKFALSIIGTPVVSPNSAFYIAPITEIGKPHPTWVKIADFSDDVTDIAVHGDDLFLLTYKKAPRYKIIHLDARKPNLASAETIVSAGEAVIQEMTTASDALYVRVLDGGIGRVLRIPYGNKSKVERIALPFDGDASILSSDPRLPGTLLLLGSSTRAYNIDAYDPTTNTVSDTRLQPSGPHDEFRDVETLEVRIPSHDGTFVPLSIVHPKGMKLDGTNPTVLYGYGAYGISMGPEFDRTYLAWYERGGVKATCHVRGGGEYGEEWHAAGKGPTKPNSWLDFIACAQYLIDKRFTSPAHLAAQGASAGGILVGRAITERPELFCAAIINFGAMDMLRIDTTANGGPNIQEFGTTKNEEGFKALYEMSPLQHVKDGTPYPAVLLTTGMNDPRVNAWQPGKMAARLQAATTSGKPVLLYVDFEAGHGGGSESSYQQESANEWGFVLSECSSRNLELRK